MAAQRVIMHVDMDAFFAAIEQREHPEYRGKPVVVGADPQGGRGRGVVSTCSYEARRYGIRSAQPISEAYRRCPDAVFLPVRGELYRDVSREMRQILHEFTPQVEPVSIDEAFLDATDTVERFGGKRQMAGRIQGRILEETELTASLGVGPNKLVAKIASDLDKPRGVVVVEPGQVWGFLRPLPVGRLWGVGEKTEERLREMGIETIGDLARTERRRIVERFGKHGAHIWQLAQGHDPRPVEVSEEVKSVGHEHTFSRDTEDRDLIASTLARLSEKVAGRLRAAGRRGRTVTTKVRLEDFTTLSRAQTLPYAVDDVSEIYRVALANLDRADVWDRPLRLVGVSVSGLEGGGGRQTRLFGGTSDGGAEDDRWRRLDETMDRLNRRFGEGALRRGSTLHRGEEDGD